MTATQRTIAEIIGWEAPEPDCYLCDLGAVRPQHTPDDLLAWLSKTEGGIELFYTPSETTVYLGFANFYAPTLLAALEAAVRAVAGES